MSQSMPAIANLHWVTDGLFAAGQPGPDDWAKLGGAGVRSVVNLRTAAEQFGMAERELVEAAGLAYAQVPVADGAALGAAVVAQVHRALSTLPAPCLVHCASANRVGAVLALRSAWHLGATPEAALEVGRRAGLASLEPLVRHHLGTAAD
ncbi:MAG: hypothetical protein KA196_07630 [Arenimonas sp.]|nr:hypothetical protein [Arenimonas sp.]